MTKLSMPNLIKHFKIDPDEKMPESLEKWLHEQLIPSLDAKTAYLLARELIILLEIKMNYDIQQQAKQARLQDGVPN